MKRGIIALILLILVAVAAGYQYIYVTTNTDMLMDMLDEADRRIEENDLLKAQDVAYRLDHRYQELENTLNIFIHHDETDSVSQSLSMLRRYAQAGNTADFLAVSASAKRALLSMHSAEIPSLQNVM